MVRGVGKRLSIEQKLEIIEKLSKGYCSNTKDTANHKTNQNATNESPQRVLRSNTTTTSSISNNDTSVQKTDKRVKGTKVSKRSIADEYQVNESAIRVIWKNRQNIVDCTTQMTMKERKNVYRRNNKSVVPIAVSSLPAVVAAAAAQSPSAPSPSAAQSPSAQSASAQLLPFSTTTGKYYAIEIELYKWIIHRRAQNLDISSSMVIAKAKEIALQLKQNTSTIADTANDTADDEFKASWQWLHNFRRRFQLSMIHKIPTKAAGNSNAGRKRKLTNANDEEMINDENENQQPNGDDGNDNGNRTLHSVYTSLVDIGKQLQCPDVQSILQVNDPMNEIYAAYEHLLTKIQPLTKTHPTTQRRENPTNHPPSETSFCGNDDPYVVGDQNDEMDYL